ncbi:MAG TPA: hypothetical protein VN816_05675 [Acidimicrobiales bacterium]|nr:hypothetical protein [Acidimicrobiales bacterium]
MAEVSVVEQATGTYIVTISDGAVATSHTVRVPSGLPEAMGCSQVPVAELVRYSMGFLLEREPPTSILRTFSLEQIGDYFPDYRATIRRTLARDPGVGGGAAGPVSA